MRQYSATILDAVTLGLVVCLYVVGIAALLAMPHGTYRGFERQLCISGIHFAGGGGATVFIAILVSRVRARRKLAGLAHVAMWLSAGLVVAYVLKIFVL